jgi:hypothetical protein
MTFKNAKIMLKLLSTLLLCLILTIHIKAQNSVPFRFNEYGHIVIKAKVEGVEGNFIFDTGAGQNVLFKRFAKKIPAKSTYNFYVGHRSTGESLKVPIYYSDNLDIGTSNFKNQLYATINIDFPNIDGLIAIQTFRNTPVVIDYEKKELIFGEIKKADKKRFIDIQLADVAGKSLDIFANVKVNDKITVQVMLDSGSGQNSFTLSADFLDVLDLNKAGFNISEQKSDFNASKSYKVYTGNIAKISTINNFANLKNPEVRFVEGLIYEGILSINWLGKKLGISIPEKRIYILD